MAQPLAKRIVPYEHRSGTIDPWRVAGDVNTFEVTSPFGYREIRLANGMVVKDAHRALDIANGHHGEPVLSPWDGRIVAEGFLKWPWSEPTPTFPTGNYGGLMVVIEHSNGLLSIFAHLEDTVIWAGDHVKAGQVVGHLGGTGSAAGSWHLHWALVRASVSSVIASGRVQNDWLVDPWPYIAGLPDTALEDDMFINLVPVREDWWTRADPPVHFWTDGPEMGERKAFVGAVRITTHGESPQVNGKSEWRVFTLPGDPRTLWVRRADLFPIPGTRVPATGSGPFLTPPVAGPTGFTQAQLDAARKAGRAEGIEAAREDLADLT